jgi:hypothetical protein
MIITIKLEIEVPTRRQRKSVSETPRKEHIDAERNQRLRCWLDEVFDRAPWNALVDARSGLNSVN